MEHNMVKRCVIFLAALVLFAAVAWYRSETHGEPEGNAVLASAACPDSRDGAEAQGERAARLSESILSSAQWEDFDSVCGAVRIGGAWYV